MTVWNLKHSSTYKNPDSIRDVWVATTHGSVVLGWFDSFSKKIWHDRLREDEQILDANILGWSEVNKPKHPNR
jgi:hypothetical protein